MTDLRMRSLSRLSASGDLHAQARLLVERLRAAESCAKCGGDGVRNSEWAEPGSCELCAGFGSVLRARIALAAYAGSEAAREAMGNGEPWVWLHERHGLKEFLQTLGRWSAVPFVAPVRAAMAAHHATHELDGDDSLECHWRTPEAYATVCEPDRVSDVMEGLQGSQGVHGDLAEPAIRTAIQQALVSWSLGP